MDKLARLNSEDRDNLTAYLDGELDENVTRRIESILTSSSAARNDVELLARTYDLLDLLPRPVGSQDFAEKTVATARLESVRKPALEGAWLKRVQQAIPLLMWSFAFLLAACCGYLVTNQWVPRQDDLLLKDLPLIQNLDLYHEVGSVQFLEELAAQRQLLEDIQGTGSP